MKTLVGKAQRALNRDTHAPRTRLCSVPSFLHLATNTGKQECDHWWARRARTLPLPALPSQAEGLEQIQLLLGKCYTFNLGRRDPSVVPLGLLDESRSHSFSAALSQRCSETCRSDTEIRRVSAGRKELMSLLLDYWDK